MDDTLLMQQAYAPIKIIAKQDEQNSDTEEEDFSKLPLDVADKAPKLTTHYFKFFKSQSVTLNNQMVNMTSEAGADFDNS